ncbi:Rab9 effector protein, partial [Thraustotheca clavata]
NKRVGIDVDIPLVEGLRFFFEDGHLAIECTNFTGRFTLSKSRTIPAALTTPVIESKKRQVEEPFVIYEDTAKRQKCISPDDKVLTKAIKFVSNEKENQNNVGTKEESKVEASEELNQARSEAPRLPLQLLKAESPEKPKSASTTPSKIKVKKTKVVKKSAEIKSFFAPKDSVKAETIEEPTPNDEIDVATSHVTQEDEEVISETIPANLESFTGTYELVSVKGTKPCQRWGATATLIGDNRIVLYGGESEEETTLSDLFIYNIQTAEWSRPQNCESIPRAWHSSVYLPQKKLMLVFGGECLKNDAMESLSDFMILDTECFLWYPPAVNGTPPTGRSGHTMCVLGSDVVVFGGTRGRNRMNSMHILDTNTWTWRSLKVEGRAPGARNYHSAVAMGKNRMVIFGGNDTKRSFDDVHVLERREADGAWFWFHPTTTGSGPTPRTGQSAVALDDNTIVIYGGWDPQWDAPQNTKLFGDVFALNIQTWQWTPMAVTPSEAMQRVGHSAVVSGTDNKLMYLFSGQNVKETRINDVHTIRLA